MTKSNIHVKLMITNLKSATRMSVLGFGLVALGLNAQAQTAPATEPTPVSTPASTPAPATNTLQPGPKDTFIAIEKPSQGTLIAIAKPKVSLSLLTAASTREPQPEWNENATNHMLAAIEAHFQAKSYELSRFDLAETQDPKAVQVTKLYEAVSGTIMTNQWIKLPTKTKFDYSLGKDAAMILPSQEKSPRYALMLDIEGTYSSSGRAALMIGAAMLGTAIPTGGQSGRAAIIDLSNGQIVWHQTSFVASGTDIRTAEGAKSFTESLFKKMPL